MIRVHKIKLNPTSEQEDYFWRASGTARFAYNWGLVRWNEIYKAGEKPSAYSIKKEFNAIKHDEFPWVREVSSRCTEWGFDRLGKAWSNYFQGLKAGRNTGRPKFKSKYKSTPSFYVANTELKFDCNLVRIPIVGWLNMSEQLRFDGRVVAGVVSHKHNRWWLSVRVELPDADTQPNQDAVGVDVGIKYLAVTSDGQIFENPKALEKSQSKIRRVSRKLDRQRRGNNPDNYNENGTVKRGVKWIKSNRQLETERKLAKLHYTAYCQRQDAHHKMTTELAKNYGLIGIEDLHVKGMIKNHRLARALSDAGLGGIRQQLEYKSNGVVKVGRFFASSKICNGCGHKKDDLTLSDRQWTCSNCGQLNERDYNAALNIRDEALRIARDENK